VLGDPAAAGELLEQGFVEPARRAVVDVLDRGLAVAQPGRTQPGLEASGRAACRLAIEQQRQPFGVGEITGLVLRLQLDEGVGHAVELQGSHLVDRWMCEH
jgi:hypothetical protein